MRIAFIDQARAVAALVVVLHHVFSYYSVEVKGTVSPIAFEMIQFVSDQNLVAVRVFFFLSGWSIWMALNRERDGKRANGWLRFAIDRSRRILPLYWLSLLVAGLLDHQVSFASGYANLLGNIVFMQTPEVQKGWFVPFGGNGPLWSLAFEAWFYAFTPAVAIVLSRVVQHAGGRETLLVLTLVIAVASVGALKVWFFPLLSYLTMWPLWVAGFVYADISSCVAQRRFAAFLALLSALTGVASYTVGSDTLWGLTIGLGASAGVILLFDATQRPFPGSGAKGVRWLSSLFERIGAGSYSLYLLHYPIIRNLHHHEVSLSLSVTAMLILIAVCCIAEPALNKSIKKLV